MSHEDFAAYLGEGRAIAGKMVTVTPGFDCLHILRINDSVEVPLVFDVYEGFESRVDRIVTAVKRLDTRQRNAA